MENVIIRKDHMFSENVCIFTDFSEFFDKKKKMGIDFFLFLTVYFLIN